MVYSIKETDKLTLHPAGHVTIHEYITPDCELSGGVAEIKGRYPEHGFVMNTTCKELVYVLEGGGRLILPSGTTAFAKGDVLLIDRNETFAWEGDMVLFMATTPTFDPAQHVEVE